MIENHAQSELTINPALKQKRWWGTILVLSGWVMILTGLGYSLLNIFGDWQQMVSTLASQARYVLLQIGSSNGLMWEVQYIVNHVRPEQLILCLPNQKIKISKENR